MVDGANTRSTTSWSNIALLSGDARECTHTHTHEYTIAANVVASSAVGSSNTGVGDQRQQHTSKLARVVEVLAQRVVRVQRWKQAVASVVLQHGQQL